MQSEGSSAFDRAASCSELAAAYHLGILYFQQSCNVEGRLLLLLFKSKKRDHRPRPKRHSARGCPSVARGWRREPGPCAARGRVEGRDLLLLVSHTTCTPTLTRHEE